VRRKLVNLPKSSAPAAPGLETPQRLPASTLPGASQRLRSMPGDRQRISSINAREQLRAT